jgi:CO/xanthine dehydrogenase Mo-binding subunit
MIGNAVALACRGARQKLFDVMAKEWKVEAKSIQAHDGEIWSEGTNYKMTMSEAIRICKKNME